MPQSEWRRYAESAIREGYEKIKEREPKLSDEQVIRKISREFYPFGEREMHPYKMWLKCIEELRKRLGVSTKMKPKDPKQPALWDAAESEQAK